MTRSRKERATGDAHAGEHRRPGAGIRDLLRVYDVAVARLAMLGAVNVTQQINAMHHDHPIYRIIVAVRNASALASMSVRTALSRS